jgi:hypothetical protein
MSISYRLKHKLCDSAAPLMSSMKHLTINVSSFILNVREDYRNPIFGDSVCAVACVAQPGKAALPILCSYGRVSNTILHLIFNFFLQFLTFCKWLALQTTNTEVPGSIPGHSLGFF